MQGNLKKKGFHLLYDDWSKKALLYSLRYGNITFDRGTSYNKKTPMSVSKKDSYVCFQKNINIDNIFMAISYIIILGFQYKSIQKLRKANLTFRYSYPLY